MTPAQLARRQEQQKSDAAWTTAAAAEVALRLALARKPCRCDALAFPHRPGSTTECVEHPDFQRLNATRSTDEEHREADNRERARDINNYWR